MLQVTDGVFQRLEKCVVMLARGMSLQQVKDSILQDVESYFCTAGLLDDTPQQKPGLRVSSGLHPYMGCKQSSQSLVYGNDWFNTSLAESALTMLGWVHTALST